MNKKICDKCKSDIPKKTIHKRLFWSFCRTDNSYYHLDLHKGIEFDLCPNCFNKLLIWLHKD